MARTCLGLIDRPMPANMAIAGPATALQLLVVAGTAKQAIGVSRRGGSTQTSPPEKALGILRRCGSSRYGRPSPREATEALVRVLDAFEAAPRVLDIGNSVIVPSTDDIALKMEERQDIDLCRSNDWSQYLRGAAWRPVFHASVEALDAARRYLSCPTPSPPPGSAGSFLGHNVKRTFGGDGTYLQKRPFLLGLLARADLGPLPVHGRGRRRAGCTMVAPGASGLRLLGVPLRRGTSGPGARRPVPAVLEALRACVLVRRTALRHARRRRLRALSGSVSGLNRRPPSEASLDHLCVTTPYGSPPQKCVGGV